MKALVFYHGMNNQIQEVCYPEKGGYVSFLLMSDGTTKESRFPGKNLKDALGQASPYWGHEYIDIDDASKLARSVGKDLKSLDHHPRAAISIHDE